MIRVSLDTPNEVLWENTSRETDRLMRDRPAPAHERVGFVRTPNGNVIKPAAR